MPNNLNHSMIDEGFRHKERTTLPIRATLDYLADAYGPKTRAGLLQFCFGDHGARFETRLATENHCAYALEAFFLDRAHVFLIEEELQPEPLAIREFARVGAHAYESRSGKMMEFLQPFHLRYLRAITGFVQATGFVTKCQANCRKEPQRGFMQLAFIYQFHPSFGRVLHPGSHLIYDGFFRAILEGTPLRKPGGEVATRALRQDLANPVGLIEDELFVRRPGELTRGYEVLAGEAYLESHPTAEKGLLGRIYYAAYA